MLVMMQEECPTTEEAVWQQFSTCYFKFGILAKRSTSGKKLFLKSIQLDDEDTLSIKSVKTSREEGVEGVDEKKEESPCE